MSPLLATVIGITVLTVIGIAFGGTFMLRVVTGKQGANDLQKTFFRAGHAHAGVLVILGLVVALLGTVSGASPGWAAAGAITVLCAAIFIPLGFFLSVLGTDPQRPGRMIASIWVGAACLVAGLLISGVAVLVAGIGGL
ncbi:hypothetical protein OG921_01105 [Aldersonia sp. NBC_00410]|uniref:hypothetical protein n=1 Tax=Aldersonia sp. NBC_00410 TaxID=2975954 RepID=UPI00225A9CD2|nr:hypothetical protein [Aldersonia sp. NBC_00410]MCX5041789.1 hypothetical protein [Aldersonia sp. NBC_00410]